MLEKILLVDDEANILAGYKRNLHSKFMVTTSTVAKDALEIIKKSEPFSVVVSDFNMPGMNGVEFLKAVREISPDTVRLMLTGYADVDTAIKAVNTGNVFRILTKPCDNETLITNIYAAVEQYRLVTAERELLDKTLKGAIKVLIDILSTVSPEAFSQATKFRTLARKIAKRMNIKKIWEIEISALLSQIGLVAIPIDIIRKKARGEEISDKENELYITHPKTGQALLKNIPRLEQIAEAIQYQFYRYDGQDEPEDYKVGDNIPLISRMLKVINDFDSFVKTGLTRIDAMSIMNADKGCYDPNILSALEAEITGVEENLIVRYVNVNQLKPGMILAESIVDDNNFPLVTMDNEVTEVMLARLENYAKVRKIQEPIKVFEDKNQYQH